MAWNMYEFSFNINKLTNSLVYCSYYNLFNQQMYYYGEYGQQILKYLVEQKMRTAMYDISS